jgi:beta-glucanase (GH16 family)
MRLAITCDPLRRAAPRERERGDVERRWTACVSSRIPSSFVESLDAGAALRHGLSIAASNDMRTRSLRLPLLALASALSFGSLACSGGSSGSAAAGEDSTEQDAATSADASRPLDAARADGPAADGSHADAGGTDTGAVDASDDTSLPGWTLTWSDEFDLPNGSAADPTKWVHETGGGGWGNDELEYYTDGTDNAVIQDGALVITATNAGASQYQCSYGTCQYTSARLKTEGLFSQQYGRFEARVQMPTGQGLWPAVWMLGENIDTVSWPACGEIDFMETIGSDISTNHGSLHAPSYDPTGTTSLPSGETFAQAFHTFAVEWSSGTVAFYVDDALYETQNESDMPGGTWEFDHAFFLVMNVAVGGQWPGSPDGTTTFPQTMKVDWIRVYQKA